MKKILIPLLAVVLSACASKGFKPDYEYDTSYNYTQVRTYAFVDREHLRSISPMVSDMTRSRVEQAIDTSMSTYGFQKVDPAQADVLLSYYVAAQEKQKITTTPSMNTGYYRCHRCYGYGGYGYGGGMSNDVHVRNYTEGTFVIDIIDRKTDTGVWRSMIKAATRKKDTDAEREARLQLASDTMIQGFPPR